jgi:tRNA-2-methylthio-N6-dimethylallyladenosine synthase
MANDVPQEEKERRRRMVEDLEERTATEINRGLLGKRVEVLVEGRHKGMWQGRTRTDKLVFFPFERDEDLAGSIVGVQIERASPWSLKGSTRQPSSVRA